MAEPGWALGTAGRLGPEGTHTIRSAEASPQRVAALTRLLEDARARYRVGERAEAVDLALRIRDETLGHHAAKVAAIGASAAVVIGMCHTFEGDEERARDAFTAAAGTLRQAYELVDARADYAADLGIALAALSDLDGADAAAPEAERLLRRAIELGENTPDVRRSLAVALRGQGRHAEAIELLNASALRTPGDWQAAAELARNVAAGGADPAEVRAAWTRAAVATCEHGPAAQAVAMFDRADAGTSAEPDVLAKAARAWTAVGRAEDGIDALRRALDLDDSHADARLGLAWAYWTLGRHADALVAYRDILVRQPDLVPALLGFAEIALLHLGQREYVPEAEEYARRAAELVPDDPAAHVAWGEALRILRRFDEAAAALDRGIALLPEGDGLTAFAVGTRGQVRAALGDPDGAIADLSRAAGLAPGLSWVHRDLGTAHADAAAARPESAEAHLAAATAHLERAVALDPADVEAAQELASLRLDGGDAEGAREVLVAALDAEPGSGPVHVLLARVDLELGRHDEALESVERAVRLDPDDAHAWHVRGQVLYAVDRVDDAVASAERAVELAPEVPDARTGLGEAYRRQGRNAEAIEQLDEALLRRPDDAWALASRGAAHLDHGDTERGVTDLCAALDAGGDSPFLMAWLGVAVLRAEPPDRVIETWERAVEQAGERAADGARLRAHLGSAHLELALTARAASTARDAHLERALAHLTAAAGADDGGDAQVHSALAIAWRMHGDPERAEHALNTALGLASTDPDTLASLAEELYLAERHDEALVVADRVLAVDEEHVRVRVTKAKTLLALERYQAGEEALAPLPADHDVSDAWATLGEIYRVSGRPELAVDALTRATGLSPDDAWAQASLGAALLASDRVDDGLAALRRAIELDPAYLFALSVLRSALANLGRHAEAVAALAAAAAAAPADVEIRIEYAIALGSAGRHRRALEIIDDLLLQDPDNSGALRIAGWLLTELGRRSDAVASYTRAVDVAPGDVGALADLADALGDNGQPEEALAVLDRAIAIEEKSGALVTRSRVLSGLGLWSAAIAAGERAVELDPGNVGAYQALGWALEHRLPVAAERMHDAFREAVRLDGLNAWTRKEFANALVLLGRAEEARAEFARAIETFADQPPTDFQAHANRGWCLFQLGRHVEADAAYLAADAGYDLPAQLAADVGLNLLVAGDEKSARAAYDQALRLVARNPSPRMRGVLSVAVVDLETVIELGRLAPGPFTEDIVHRFARALRDRPLPEGLAALADGDGG